MSTPESFLLAVASATPLLAVGIAALWEKRQAKKPAPAHDPSGCRYCARLRHPSSQAQRLALTAGLPRQARRADR